MLSIMTKKQNAKLGAPNCEYSASEETMNERIEDEIGDRLLFLFLARFFFVVVVYESKNCQHTGNSWLQDKMSIKLLIGKFLKKIIKGVVRV